MTAPVAFDHERQVWIDGAPAAELLARQIREELELLRGPKGEAYARFVQSDRHHRIADLESALAEVVS